MRPLLKISQAALEAARELGSMVGRDFEQQAWPAGQLSLCDMLVELDAQRAEPTREPLSQAPQDAAGTHLEGGKIGHWPTNVVVDAATIRRQVLEEAIAARPAFEADARSTTRRYGYNDGILAYQRALEALRDPADAHEAGKG